MMADLFAKFHHLENSHSQEKRNNLQEKIAENSSKEGIPTKTETRILLGSSEDGEHLESIWELFENQKRKILKGSGFFI